jgi:hypothetical protein
VAQMAQKFAASCGESGGMLHDFAAFPAFLEIIFFQMAALCRAPLQGILFRSTQLCSPLPAFLEIFLVRKSRNHEGVPRVSRKRRFLVQGSKLEG